MVNILNAIEEASGLLVYPNLSSSKGECIVYTYEPQADDGIKKQDRLTIRLITKDIPTAVNKSNAIKQALITVADQNKNEVLDCKLNGGGVLYDSDTAMQHTIMYFYLTMKSEVYI